MRSPKTPLTSRRKPPTELVKIRRSNGRLQWVTRQELDLLEQKRYREFRRLRALRLWQHHRWRLVAGIAAAGLLLIALLRLPSPSPPTAETGQISTPAQGAAEPASLTTRRETLPILSAPPSTDADRQQAVELAVRRWVEAWSRQDLAEYFSCYSPWFRPEDGRQLGDWRGERRRRLTRPASIEVSVSGLEIETLHAGHVVARFVQSYRSPSYSDQTSKLVDLVNEDGRWLILRERAES